MAGENEDRCAERRNTSPAFNTHGRLLAVDAEPAIAFH